MISMKGAERGDAGYRINAIHQSIEIIEDPKRHPLRRLWAEVELGWHFLRAKPNELLPKHPRPQSRWISLGVGLNPRIFSPAYIELIERQNTRDFLTAMKGAGE